MKIISGRSLSRGSFSAPEMNIQAPPNLSAGELAQLIAAGINDWGGVSPVTPDHVNPEAPWPDSVRSPRRPREAGKVLTERLSIYPSYRALSLNRWLDPRCAAACCRSA